jgi:glycine dehydrogenase
MSAFVDRHLGPREADLAAMLETLGEPSLDAFIAKVVPASIRLPGAMALPAPSTEGDALAQLAAYAKRNQRFKSWLGMGYHDTVTPGVILRNVLENPGWYTAYTPYQAEIAQGRLEALLAFQTMVQDLTGFEVSNASLLDESTAAAEAMTASKRIAKNPSDTYFIADSCHPQTIAVVATRAEAAGIGVIVGDPATFDFSTPVFGALLQYPATDGAIFDPGAFIEAAHAHGAVVTLACDLLSLTLLTPPAALGADLAVGSSQRFGVPLGYGGPHAAFLAGPLDSARKLPGRIIGVSKDTRGAIALRMSLQTREQHIRRAKATSNVCTAQVLLAVTAAFYAIYHGPEGLRAIAERTRGHAATLAASLTAAGWTLHTPDFFDTIRVSRGADGPNAVAAARAAGVNLRAFADGSVGVAFDETTTATDVAAVLAAFGATAVAASAPSLPAFAQRTTGYLTHPTFSRYRSETEMLRYIHRLQSRDLSLTAAMIPLGSCTMKLNATAEMAAITWPEFGGLHPFVPVEQAQGYQQLFQDLEAWLAEVTGFAAVSLQPNAGSQGEYAGLLVIRAYHRARGDAHRTICLIPTSAHGTNPASAVMAGMEVVEVACDARGNVDVADLRAKAAQHADNLAALMVTYPSTHGVFESSIREICDIVHGYGGQVYMDGANMNAQVGLTSPGFIGADVCHLNLHKTFCIPHGGGGPGMGPIGVGAHLAPFLPGHPVVACGGSQAIGPVSAAPWGSASILPISWAYIRMMGSEGLTHATKVAILSANYIAKRLEPHYPTLYVGEQGYVAHECILDPRGLKDTAGIEVDDIAKRLMDYGFHGPTMSFPVSGTLMVEPTESESKEELDRFIDAMIGIRDEIRQVEAGAWSRTDNPLKGAPHVCEVVGGDVWTRGYPRSVAGWPTPHQRSYKFWPTVGRVDNVYGDKNLITGLSGLDRA